MPSGDNTSSTPRHVAIVGGGIEGLTTAWFLQEHGCDVTIFERDVVGAGASHGNAGWLTPSLVAPLAEPSVLGFGLLNVFKPDSPLYITPKPSLKLWKFLAGFMLHCLPKKWRAGTASLVALNSDAIDSFQRLKRGGVEYDLKPADPFLCCFETKDDSKALVDELKELAAAGQQVSFDEVTGADAAKLSPALTNHVGHVVRLHDQYFVNPSALLHAVADSVRARGGRILEHHTVTGVTQEGEKARVSADFAFVAGGDREVHGADAARSADAADMIAPPTEFDAVVVATGAWMSALAKPLGVKVPVQAGRGYSFSVPTRNMPSGPVYLPKQRVACTPLGDRLRIAGMMEFKHVDAPLDPRRIRAISDAASPFLKGIDLTQKQDHWVGGRPCTPDGLPLVGATASPRVFVNGGYGMWGVTLGPLCGRLLADQIVTGEVPAQLKPLNPLR